MKKPITIMLALLAIANAKANDGAFYSKGNQLIPITETTIHVQKEILTITRVPDSINGWGDLFKVDVYYEFFNPGPAKDLIVGFEATSADGNAYGGTLDEAYAGQPFIYDFNVVMNDRKLPHQVAHVPYKYNGDYQFDYTIKTEDYYKNGKVQDMSKEQYSAAMAKIFESEEEYLDWYGYLFYYVYHFNAHFNEGLNVIRHTYYSKGAEMVMMDYLFDYILTAANRWANNGIDDFTLILNMGDRESFSVNPTFFNSGDEWTFSGKGKVGKRYEMLGLCENCPVFHVQSGRLVFHKKNFHPEGELHIDSSGFYAYLYMDGDGKMDYPESFVEDFKTRYCSVSTDEDYPISRDSFTDEQRRILKNVPFAYRGYVFKDKSLQSFFESTDWYIPDPGYNADMTTMTPGEKKWVQYWTK